MQTLDSIINLIEEKVINNLPISASQWIEYAMRINALRGELSNQVALLESELLNIESTLIQADIPAAKAKVLARGKIDYKLLLELHGKEKRVEELIRLAKKRANINEM